MARRAWLRPDALANPPAAVRTSARDASSSAPPRSIGPGTWGGPTLAGAWILHAVLGVLLLPVFVAVLIGLTRLAARCVHGLSVGGRGPGWVTPVVLLVDAAAAVFLVAFVRQL